LVDAPARAKGNQSVAADILGVQRVTVWNRMKKYGIDVHKLITA
jgi:two-component system response regulator HydG